jgi:uncharacterized membrane protein
VEKFFQSSTGDQERIKLIQQFHIDYVFWGPTEQALGDWNPDGFAGLTSIYQQGAWKIYQVSGYSP